MKKEAFKARVEGMVQGVWFRKYTKDKADALGIKGFVRNEPDGTVYVEAEGEPEQLKILKEWLYEGSPLSDVKNVKIEEIPVKGYETFEIVY